MIATDAELEALLTGDEPETAHLYCVHCWGWNPPAEAMAACGYADKGDTAPGSTGMHKCAKCVALEATSPLPCGHP